VPATNRAKAPRKTFDFHESVNISGEKSSTERRDAEKAFRGVGIELNRIVSKRKLEQSTRVHKEGCENAKRVTERSQIDEYQKTAVSSIVVSDDTRIPINTYKLDERVAAVGCRIRARSDTKSSRWDRAGRILSIEPPCTQDQII